MFNDHTIQNVIGFIVTAVLFVFGMTAEELGYFTAVGARIATMISGALVASKVIYEFWVKYKKK